MRHHVRYPSGYNSPPSRQADHSTGIFGLNLAEAEPQIQDEQASCSSKDTMASMLMTGRQISCGQRGTCLGLWWRGHPG